MTEATVQTIPHAIYLAPEQARWLGSMEGVPDADGFPTPVVVRQNALYRGLDWLGERLPGLALCAALAWFGAAIADFLGKTLLGFEKSPISAIAVTILLGLFIRNAAGLPATYEKGLRFAVKQILRLGIALLGLQLSLSVVGRIGLSALPIVFGCIAAALILVGWLGRAVKLPHRLGTLIAVGTSICGASAIVAAGPVLRAEDEEISYAVACITLFGMIAMFSYPMLSHWMFAADPEQVGLFLGTAIHDTSQVAGAGMMYQQFFETRMPLDVATTTKLVRNVCMSLIIPLMAVLYHRRGNDDAARRSFRWHQFVPLFVVAFVGLAALRSAGDFGTRAFGLLEREAWKELLAGANAIAAACLTVAMAAIGLGTSVAQLKSLGWKPLFVALTAALLVGGVSFSLVKLISVIG
jgi:uncharacterized integral membrane protein (TIGR00698 family)